MRIKKSYIELYSWKLSYKFGKLENSKITHLRKAQHFTKRILFVFYCEVNIYFQIWNTTGLYFLSAFGERNEKNDYKSNVIETLHLDATSCSTIENCIYIYIYISSEVHVFRITLAESQCTEILSRVKRDNYKAEFERKYNLNHSFYKIINLLKISLV